MMDVHLGTHPFQFNVQLGTHMYIEVHK